MAKSRAKTPSISTDPPPWDEEVVETPLTLPAGDVIKWARTPAASARLLVDRSRQRFEGINPTNLDELGIKVRDLVDHRAAIRSALLGVVRDGGAGPSAGARGTAVAYMAALKVGGVNDVLAGVATSTDDPPEVRGLAIEAIGRLDEADVDALVAGLSDPDATVRERAVRCLGAHDVASQQITRLAKNDPDAEVRRVAREVSGKGTPRKPVRRGRLTEVPPGVRPLGRGPASQTQGQVPEGALGFGGRDVVTEARLAAVAPPPVASFGYEVLDSTGDSVRIRLVGEAATDAAITGAARKWATSTDRVVVDVPAEMLTPGRALPLQPCDCGPVDLPHWTAEGPGSAAVTAIDIPEGAIWVGGEFSVRVSFEQPSDAKVSLLRLDVELPDGRGGEAVFEVSEDEQAAGAKVVTGYSTPVAGPVRLTAYVYTEAGGAGWRRRDTVALPTNPMSMSISPTTTGRNNKGPAHFNQAENRFYCYATGRVTNGFPRRLTVGPAVTCRITDGGTLLQSFNFSIGTFTVNPNSWAGFNMFVWVGAGSATHDVFLGHGDVRIEFTIATSEGMLSASAVWVAMAKVDLALNFVGNFTDERRFAAQAAVENEASAVLEAKNLYIGDTWTFLIPSTHADWGRYRDIRMEDNKDHDCTAGSNEADDMRGGWSSPNRGWLDVWFVESLSGPACAANVLGFSPVNGPTDKNSDDSGFVIRVNGADFSTDNGRRYFGLTVAHELGHYLGLEHITDDATNFMGPFNNLSNTAVRFDQFLDMSDHPFVRRFAF
ncbi:MAG TPA: HEAT repeat domain-containing protein [Microthrixaceae bacterium]|nr:HEAT repeat domain-containing protein [Microthrixaceae bacterium]